MRFFSENKFGKYLLYALGEILLVVIGILVALKINNWNEGKKRDNLLQGIYTTISNDLKRDTIMLSTAITYYEKRRDLAQRILKNELSDSDYDQCIDCYTLVTSYFPLVLNDKGFTQLKSFSDGPEQRDSLTVDIIQFYNTFGELIDDLGTRVEDNSASNFQYWSENYSWFAHIVSGQPDEEFRTYIRSDQDFRNRVAYTYTLAGLNYLNVLIQYKANAIVVLEAIEKRVPENEED